MIKETENPAEWVRKAQQGDEQAFISLFSPYEADLYRTAYVYVKHPEDAMDVVQETAYRSFKSIGSLKKAELFKSWVIQIAIRCSIDILRKRKTIVPMEAEKYETLAPSREEDLSLPVTMKLLMEALEEDEKSLVILRFYYDYTLKDIANMLQLPLGTAKTNLYRALKKLRKASKEEDIYGP